VLILQRGGEGENGMSDNAQQIEFWNGPSGRRWASLADTMDRSLSFITAALMPFASAKKGERVLDVGCGCGTTTLALSEAVGPSGAVTAIDVSRPMLDVARGRAAEGGAKVSFLEADASIHAFKPECDLVFSRFGVMFFADPPGAFANIRKALLSTGRLAFVCWRALPENAWAARPLAAALELLPPQPPVDPYAPGPFAFADNARLAAILSEAGFQSPRMDKLDTVMNLGATIDDAAQAALNVGPLARIARELDEATKAKIRDRVSGVLSQFKTPAGITPPAACWLVSARA
jgi:ubiquinone/menaquinone biosynthesis C-methylase UbiE